MDLTPDEQKPYSPNAPLLIFPLAIWAVLMYTFLHEAGHALVVLVSGGSITEFNINFINMGAHVGINGSFTTAQMVARSLAGLLFPLLAWAVFMLAVPRKGSGVLETVKLLTSAVLIGSLIPWMIVSLSYADNPTGPTEDISQFLYSSNLNPYLSALLFLLLGIGVFLFARRRVGDGGALRRIATGIEDDISIGANRRVYLGLLGSGALAILVTVLANALAAPSAALPAVPPAGYELAQRIELSARDYNGEPVVTVDVTDQKPAGFFIVAKGIKATLLDVRLSGPAGYEELLLRGEAYSAELDSAKLEKQLTPGQYQVLLTNTGSSGELLVYVLK